jgi:dipeptidase
MGAYQSTRILQDFQPNQNESFEYNIHTWMNTKPKNWDYYNGTRFFKISRSLYPDQYERGVLYGYSYLPQYHYTTFLQDDGDEDERVF